MVSDSATARRHGGSTSVVPGPLAESEVFACFVLDDAGRILDANALAWAWLGVDEKPGSAEFGRWLVRPADRRKFLDALHADGVVELQLSIGPVDGSARFVRGELIPVSSASGQGRFLALFGQTDSADVLAGRLQRSARLEALGSLTSGVAHDFNNLLTILVGNLSLLAEDLRGNARQFAKIKAARDAAKRGGDLIKQLLGFARQEPVPSRLVNPAKVISKIAPLIERALGKPIDFRLDIDEHLDPVQGNAAQLESAIVNLAVNARDAIEGSGTVTVSVKNERIQSRSDAADSLPPGRYLRISVTDDGAGIPPELAEKVFEPFFTTKGDGRGSGLGLSMVKAYAEQFGGFPQIVSEPGRGTCVSLWFPSHAGVVEETAAMTAPVAALPSGNEMIAVLAEDEGLCSMLEQILSVLGYRCRLIVDPENAEDLLVEPRPELWISDGYDVDALLGACPPDSRRRVLMLGSTVAGKGTHSGRVLNKPFSIPDLAAAVRETLDAGPEPHS